MPGPVIVIGLDSADPDLYDNYMNAGHLKNLQKLRQTGCYVHLNSLHYSAAEASWTAVLAGVVPEKTGFWSQIRFNRKSYGVEYVGSYAYKDYPLFYELGDSYNVAAIDIPQARLSEQVNGIQILGYGSHSQQGPRQSRPKNVLAEMIQRYGDHPAYEKDGALLWRSDQLERLTEALKIGATRRGAMCADLIREHEWDLFFTVFGEPHSGGHYLWHISQDNHPFHEVYNDLLGEGRDPLLEVLNTVDDAVGAIIDAAPADSTFIVFSQEGMVPNNLDLPSLVFLPELLYRFSFPGQRGLIGSVRSDNAPPPQLLTKSHGLGWTRAVLASKQDKSYLLHKARQLLPMEVSYGLSWLLGDRQAPRYPGLPFGKKGIPHWMGPIWYQNDWHKMKAFALPSFSDGYVRINVKGRETHGIVDPADYDELCDELSIHFREIRNARTGRPIVREIIRTRKSVSEDDDRLPDADLVVMWDDDPADVVDTPRLGRIGPILHRRSGGHNANCFAVFSGTRINAGTTLPPASALDISPTILKLLGAPIPSWFDGRPLSVSRALS